MPSMKVIQPWSSNEYFITAFYKLYLGDTNGVEELIKNHDLKQLREPWPLHTACFAGKFQDYTNSFVIGQSNDLNLFIR